MRTIRTWTARAASVTALSAAAVLGFAGLAHADNITDSIEDSGAGVTLVAGSGTAGTATIKVIAVGNTNNNVDGDPGCNWDTGEDPLVLDFLTPAGVTANPDPLSITSCGTDVAVSFTAGSTAVSGTVTVAIVATPAGGGTYHNNVKIPITITQPTNTAPSVAVKGVTDGASYEIGHVPTATCEATDKEDGPSAPAPVVTGTLSHGLGTQTVLCETTDSGGLKASASATYQIVDTADPTIAVALDPAAPNAAGWYKDDVTVDFTCADSGSGIQSCTDDVILGEGQHAPMTGTATDWAGNTATANVPAINVDKTAPTSIQFTGGPADGSTHYGAAPAAPTGCTATDTLSGLASCVVTGGGTGFGTYTHTATATDVAGNSSTATLSYSWLQYGTLGFHSPVEMNGVWNTVKGGATVPLKFEVFAGSTEKDSTAVVTSFKQKQVACPGSDAAFDSVDVTTTGGTSLRFDSSGHGQFIQNWQTPKKPGTCHQATVTLDDGSTIAANFMLK